MSKNLLFLIALCLFAGSLYAQDTTKRIIHLDEVRIKGGSKDQSLQQIRSKDIRQFQGSAGSFEQILRWMPGVSSSNEMSSQYAVRGGSFDENLVFLNGIEVYRPLMNRTAQQEGLSVIHPDLVSSVEFSAGGFGAEYGDKMSSVLSVRYRKPQQTEARFSASLLGGSLSAGTCNKKGTFTALFGARYKTSNYLLSGMDEKGIYQPHFFDIQAVLGYQFNPRMNLQIVGNYALNSYRFAPESRETSYGTLNEPRQFVMYYDGTEWDAYTSGLLAATLNYRTDQSQFSFSTAWTRIDEKETYDILGTYRLRDIESGSFIPSPDESMNLDLASMQDHARNFMYSDVLSLSHQASSNLNKIQLNWGICTQWIRVSDHMNEWRMLDSAGFSLPNRSEEVRMDKYVRADHILNQFQSSGFIQAYDLFRIGKEQFSYRVGIRSIFTARNNQFILSPRMNFDWKPSFAPQWNVYLSGGHYAQPAFYKEMRDPEGVLHTGLKAQQAWTAVWGCKFPFQVSGINFHFTTELYVKRLRDLVPYRMDNLRIVYAGENSAKGSIMGLDVKINAQLLEDAESWINFSFLRTRETIGEGKAFPMPQDQVFFASLFLQDYLPNNPLFRIQLLMNYGSGLPVQNPSANRYDSPFRLPAYKRVDLGLMYEIFHKDKPQSFLHRWSSQLRGVQQISMGLEALNLFDFMNTASYLWVKTLAQGGVGGGMVAVPNYLSPLRVNAKVSVSF